MEPDEDDESDDPELDDCVCCRECLADDVELTDGLCDECAKEDCPECEGTGYSGEWDDEEGATGCDYCGGDGVV